MHLRVRESIIEKLVPKARVNTLALTPPRSCQARLQSAIGRATSLKFIQKVSSMAAIRREHEFVRIVVSRGICLGLDAHFMVSIWGDSKSRSEQACQLINLSFEFILIFWFLIAAVISLQVAW